MAAGTMTGTAPLRFFVLILVFGSALEAALAKPTTNGDCSRTKAATGGIIQSFVGHDSNVYILDIGNIDSCEKMCTAAEEANITGRTAATTLHGFINPSETTVSLGLDQTEALTFLVTSSRGQVLYHTNCTGTITGAIICRHLDSRHCVNRPTGQPQEGPDEEDVDAEQPGDPHAAEGGHVDEPIGVVNNVSVGVRNTSSTVSTEHKVTEPSSAGNASLAKAPTTQPADTDRTPTNISATDDASPSSKSHGDTESKVVNVIPGTDGGENKAVAKSDELNTSDVLIIVGCVVGAILLLVVAVVAFVAHGSRRVLATALQNVTIAGNGRTLPTQRPQGVEGSNGSLDTDLEGRSRLGTTSTQDTTLSELGPELTPTYSPPAPRTISTLCEVIADQASAGNDDAGTRAGGRIDEQNPSFVITQNGVNGVVNVFMGDPNAFQSQSSGTASPQSQRPAPELDGNEAESVRDNNTNQQPEVPQEPTSGNDDCLKYSPELDMNPRLLPQQPTPGNDDCLKYSPELDMNPRLHPDNVKTSAPPLEVKSQDSTQSSEKSGVSPSSDEGGQVETGPPEPLDVHRSGATPHNSYLDGQPAAAGIQSSREETSLHANMTPGRSPNDGLNDVPEGCLPESNTKGRSGVVIEEARE